MQKSFGLRLQHSELTKLIKYFLFCKKNETK